MFSQAGGSSGPRFLFAHAAGSLDPVVQSGEHRRSLTQAKKNAEIAGRENYFLWLFKPGFPQEPLRASPRFARPRASHGPVSRKDANGFDIARIAAAQPRQPRVNWRLRFTILTIAQTTPGTDTPHLAFGNTLSLLTEYPLGVPMKS